MVFSLAAFTRATQLLASALESCFLALAASLLLLFYLYALFGLLQAFWRKEVFRAP